LGKTIQVISFLQFIKNKYDRFPFLIIAPNSTLDNWGREFEKWAPNLHVVTMCGTPEDRMLLQKYELFAASPTSSTSNKYSLKCHVVLISFEVMLICSPLKQVSWDVGVIDEGHRLKNDESKLFQYLQNCKMDHRILLTGTPLQNNLRELFNIMSFVAPNEFHDPEGLRQRYDLNQEEPSAVLTELHVRLRPHFLRRVKSQIAGEFSKKIDIVVPIRMSPLQRELIKDIYSTNFNLLKALGRYAEKKGSGNGRNASLNNILVQCRKVLSHPYILDGVENGLPLLDCAHEKFQRLVDSCGKLELLSQMLPRLRAGGHKILVFCQFISTLDVLERYLDELQEQLKSGTAQEQPLMPPFHYYRLDGGTHREDRQRMIDTFNQDPEAFIFLLSTRAGGVGINLTAADTVIIYDVDWNPHMDAQAIARAHRIGQKRTVLSLKFVTRNSVEEKILAIGQLKLALDKAVVQNMRLEADAVPDLPEIIKHGVSALFNEAEWVSKYSDEEIDQLLDRSRNEDALVDTAEETIFGYDRVCPTTEVLPPPPDVSAQNDSWEPLLEKLRQLEPQLDSLPNDVLTRRRKRATQGVYCENADNNIVPKAEAKHKKGANVDEDFVAVSEVDSEASEGDDTLNLTDVSADLSCQSKRKRKRPKHERNYTKTNALEDLVNLQSQRGFIPQKRALLKVDSQQRNQAIPMTHLSTGAATAFKFSRNIPCWICVGSHLEGIDYHLPLNCPSLLDLQYVRTRLAKIQSEFGFPGIPPMKAAEYFLRTILESKFKSGAA
jgi:hypothetical protein